MTGYALGKLSLERLEGVHPDLVQVVKRAIQISPVDFMVVEGKRTLERQKKLVAEGKSTTMNSRHLSGHAVDLAAYTDGDLEWGAPEHDQVAEAMKTAAGELGYDLEWGGDWTSFIDPPHFQLSWKAYPKQASWTEAPTTAARTDKEIAKDLANNSTKYKSTLWAEFWAWVSGIFAAAYAVLMNIGDAISKAVGSGSLTDLISLMQKLGTIGADIWWALCAMIVTVAVMFFRFLRKRQVEEVKKGTYEPSAGRF